jgi:hypothetical protein
VRMLRITHLRDKTLPRDRAIVDSLELLEGGLVPGEMTSRELCERWQCEKHMVSIRLRAMTAVGLVCSQFSANRYELWIGPELTRQQDGGAAALEGWRESA